MSTHSGPNIVENGLVLSLDAANPKSFRGEPTTNLLPQPLSFETGYTKESWTGTITDNYGIAPDGTQTATLVSRTGGYLYKRNTTSPSFSIAAGDTITFSCWVKKNDSSTTSGKGISIWSYSLGSQIRAWSTEEIYNDRWTRLSVTYTAITGEIDFSFAFVGSHANQFSGSILIWHPQVEIKPYATDFIVGTRGSTVSTGGGLIDLSGNENHGTLYERTLGLRAYSNYIDFPDPTGSVGYNYGYLRSNIPTGPISYTAIMFFYPYSVSGERHLFRTSNNFGANIVSGRIQYYTTSYNVETAYTPNNSVSENNWHFFSLVYDRDNSKHIAYINGKFASEKQHSTQYSIINGYQNWGARNDAYAAGLNGRIGKILMYDRPLSAEENMQIFNAYRGRYGI